MSESSATPESPAFLVVAPFFSLTWSGNRPRLVAEALAGLGAVDLVTGDFDHQRKSCRPAESWSVVRRIVQLPTPAYRSNVSVRRFVSHLVLSIRAARYVRANAARYTAVYVSAPIALLAAWAFASGSVRLRILDVVDVWPDSLPFPRWLRLLGWPGFRLWRWSFEIACSRADVLLAVSDQCLADGLRHFKGPAARAARFYPSHDALPGADPAREAVFTIVYVGNIGRLYDLDTLLAAMSLERGRWQLFIVGEGDRRAWLLEELSRRDLPHEYFGSVYEPAALARILRRAHVGFNGYRDTSAAFSYKAATYLAAGLPLLNSMSGDLETLVPTHGLGSNYRAGDVDSLLASLRTIEQSPPEHWELQSRRYFQHEVEHSAVVAKLRRFLDGCVRRPEAPASSTRSVLDEVLAVLVLYRQDLAQSPTYLSLGGELRRLGAQLDLLVYDNSEQASSLPENAPADGWRISYQHDGTNPGVSRAYVEGARLGASRGKRWLLLLDQDTVFPPGALDAYVDAVRRHPDARLFAPILRVAGRIASPCGYRFKRGRPLEGIRPGTLALRGRSVVNSGLWIGLEAYLAAGGHDPRIPLDFADHEFIARYKRRSDSLVVVDVECQHSLSASQPARPAAVVERFRYYCLGARHATRGVWDGLLTAGVVAGRALLLALRHREPAFLRVAADTLFHRDAS